MSGRGKRTARPTGPAGTTTTHRPRGRTAQPSARKRQSPHPRTTASHPRRPNARSSAGNRAGSRAGRRRRQQRQGDERLVLLVAIGGGAFLCVALIQWLLAHWWILAAAAAIGAATAAWSRQRQARRRQWEQARAHTLRYSLDRLDALHHTQFEFAIRDLLRRDGCADAERTGGRGDLGADVIATDPLGRRWVVQCKHRRAGQDGSPVGSRDLQVVNGTARPVHGADVVVVVTNGRFTRDAVSFGDGQRMHLVPRELLGRWAGGPWPLWDLLRRIPPPRAGGPVGPAPS